MMACSKNAELTRELEKLKIDLQAVRCECELLLTGTVDEPTRPSNSFQLPKDFKPVLLQTVPCTYQGNHSVRGLATLHDTLYVMRRKSSAVEVYDVTTFISRPSLFVPGLATESYGLAACGVNDCLYVSDSTSDQLHRVDL